MFQLALFPYWLLPVIKNKIYLVFTFKGNNGTYVQLTEFSPFYKFLLVIELNYFNNFNGTISTILNGYSCY